MKEQQFEQILHEAFCPEIDDRELTVHYRKLRKGNSMNIRKIMKNACLAAAVAAMLISTAYAAGELNIKTLISGKTSRVYDTVQKAEEQAGFRMDDLDRFSNGYGFQQARVGETRALDENDKVRLTYNEISVELKNTAGERLNLTAHEYQEGIVASSVPADQVRQMGDITLEYRLHHYKLVPEDYTQTEADRLWLQKPGNFLSYGSEEGIKETDVAFLNWEKEGICYILMDSDASETAESLFSMARELILSGK